MGFLKGILKLVVFVAVLLGITAFVARFMDGPLIMLPGGPLVSGEMVTDPDVDWAQFKDVQEIELESDGRSRITWILVKDDAAYIPASLAFPPEKTWHEQILIDPVATLRIDGKRYPVTLTRVDDEAEKTAIQAANVRQVPGSSRQRCEQRLVVRNLRESLSQPLPMSLRPLSPEAHSALNEERLRPAR